MILIQWNIQWCRGLDGRVDPRRIVDAARAMADFDVLCVQEVADNFPALAGSAGEDQPALLASLLPGYEMAFAPAVDAPAGGGARRRFGNVLLSRLPVRQVLRHSLPRPAHEGVPSMQRVALEAVIETPFGLARVTTTHLEYYSGVQRAAQVERLRDLHAEAAGQARAKPSDRYDSGPFQPLPRPASAILCGDFNMPKGPSDEGYARLVAPIPGAPRLVDAFPLVNPGVAHPPSFCVHEQTHGDKPYCCDFVFVTEDLAPRVRAVRYDLDTRASDHQPVIVEFS